MPCYQVNTVSVDLQAGNLELLRKTASALGLTVEDRGAWRQLCRGGVPIAVLESDKARCATAEVATINKLRVEYSRAIVNQAALKMGWQKVVKSENKLLLRKGV